MSLIASTQKVNILNERSKNSFLTGDFSLLLSDKSDYKVTYGEPITQLYNAKYFTVADPALISRYNDQFQIDVNTCVNAVNKIWSLANTSNEILLNTALRLDARAKALTKQSDFLRSITTSQATWGYIESFYNFNNIDTSLTNCFIDSERQVCTIPSNLNYVFPLEGKLLDVSYKGCNPLNTSFDSNFKAMAFNREAQAVLEFECDGMTFTEVKLFPVGNKTRVVIEVLQKNTWNTIINSVLTETGTYPVLVSEVETLRLTISTVSEEFPSLFGLEKFIFSQLKFNKQASLYSSALQPSQLFSGIKLEVDENVPTGCSVKYFVKVDSGSWRPIKPDNWVLTSDKEINEVVISLDSLEDNGLYYYTSTLENISEGINEGQLVVGRDQFEVSAFKRIAITEKTLLPTLSSDYFETNAYTTCWGSPVPVTQSTTESNSVEYLLSDYGVDNSELSKSTLSFIGEQDSGFTYTSLAFLPINQSYGSSSLRPNTVYRIKTRFYAEKESFVDFGKFWFLQGYKTPASRTFQQQGVPYGNFLLLVNGVSVAQSNSAFTLYTDGTSESGASTGINWSFYIREGWNEWELLIYVPEIPSLVTDLTIDASRYLQLTLYPNILDTEFKRDFEITQVISTGEFPPTTEFDLAYNFPRSFKYWAWKQAGLPNKVALNKSSADLIDGFIGKEDSNQPALSIKYSGFNSSIDSLANTSVIRYKADLYSNQNTTLAPWIKKVGVLTK